MKNKTILRLTIRLEIYTNVFIGFLDIYFAIIAGGYDFRKAAYLIASAVISALLMDIAGIAVRIRKLSSIINSLDDKNCDYRAVKLQLLSYPRIEGVIICLRWFFGIILCYNILGLFEDLSLLDLFIFVFIFLISVLINFSFSFFATENMLSQFFEHPQIRRAKLSRDSYKPFTVFRRTLLILSSIILQPIVILSFFIYISSTRQVIFENLGQHLAIMLTVSLMTIVAATYEATTGMRKGLSATVKSLEKLERGDFDADPVPMYTRTEIDIISQHVNVLADSLKNSNEILSKSFWASPVGIAIISMQKGIYININDSFMGITGFSREEIIGKADEEIGIFKEPHNVNMLIRILQETGKLINLESEMVTRMQQEKTVSISGDIIILGKEPYVIITIEDITERKLLEKEIINVSERERQRIGQNLSDDIVPHLLDIKVLYSVLRKRISDKSFVDIYELEQIGELIRSAIGKTRILARGLGPINMAGNGLEILLKDLALHIENLYALPCSVESDLRDPIEEEFIKINLYHIAQEAAINIIKYGKAKSICIKILSRDNVISLSVVGKGVESSWGDENTDMVNRIMHYRAQTIGAEFSLLHKKEGAGYSLYLEHSSEGA
jgi:PAS domain S-box-containing protein